ncbi:redoxin domain-containing protein [Ureibacillus manganicus]|uniref:redoxin domain-containing protein n=1 Tax=Ureibacillus manganicus TaxID=1266064 RepID=UPI00068B57F4|nr:redoxin domain-containing protein [Ureibacillus manganicus]
MSYIEVGNISVKTEWAAFLLALVLFMLAEKLFYKKSESFFQDALFYYIIVWKLSYILIEWPMFIKNPISALYFSGGVWGHILAVIVVSMILIYRTKIQSKILDWYGWLYSFLEFYLLFQGSEFLLTSEWVAGAVIIIAYVYVAIRNNNKENSTKLFILILLNSIFLAYNQKLFALEGWLFISISTIALLLIVLKERHLLKNILSWVFIVILAASVALNFEKDKKTIVIGEATDFELQTISGETVRLSDYRGKKVILNFWATWCPPCKAEMPHMQKFYEEHGDEIEVIAVNLTSRDNGVEAVEKFVGDNGLTFTIPLDVNGEYGDAYEIFSIPTTYIIDEKGQIYQKIVGPMDKNTLESFLN